MIIVTATCEENHCQTISVGKSLGMDWAKAWAGLMDGTSPMYQKSPIGDPITSIGKCGICGKQFTCTVKETP